MHRQWDRLSHANKGTQDPGQLCGSSCNTLQPARLFQPESISATILALGCIVAGLASLPLLSCAVPCGGFAGHTGVVATLGRQQVCPPEQLLNKRAYKDDKSPPVTCRSARTTGCLLSHPCFQIIGGTYLLMIHLSTYPSLLLSFGVSCTLHFYNNYLSFPFPHT